MPVRLIKTPRFGGERGWFSETYNARRFAADGIAADFVQDNHSYSREAGTVRGLHFQLPPSAQDKLVRVTRGRILDVAVDIRRGSPTYGRFVAVELSDASGDQLFIPVGFAHAFCTLKADTEVLYKVSAFYAPEGGRGPQLERSRPRHPLAGPGGGGHRVEKGRRTPDVRTLREPVPLRRDAAEVRARRAREPVGYVVETVVSRSVV